jgi:hypothetical protein
MLKSEAIRVVSNQTFYAPLGICTTGVERRAREESGSFKFRGVLPIPLVGQGLGALGGAINRTISQPGANNPA